ARARGGPEAAAATRCLDQAMAAVSAVPVPASLYGGLTGVGWAVAHLEGGLLGIDRGRDLDEIDEALGDHLRPAPWSDDFDLVAGLVGLGVYALERLPRPAAAACLERVVGHLAAAAECLPAGVAWWTDPRWLPP